MKELIAPRQLTFLDDIDEGLTLWCALLVERDTLAGMKMDDVAFQNIFEGIPLTLDFRRAREHKMIVAHRLWVTVLRAHGHTTGRWIIGIVDWDQNS